MTTQRRTIAADDPDSPYARVSPSAPNPTENGGTR